MQTKRQEHHIISLLKSLILELHDLNAFLLTKKYVSSHYPFETLSAFYTYLILVSLLVNKDMKKWLFEYKQGIPSFEN